MKLEHYVFRQRLNDQLALLKNIESNHRLPINYREAVNETYFLIQVMITELGNSDEYKSVMFTIANLMLNEKYYRESLDFETGSLDQKVENLKSLNKKYLATLAHYSIELSRQYKIGLILN